MRCRLQVFSGANLLLVAILGIVVSGARAADLIRAGDTVVIPLRGEIGQPQHLFLRRGLKAAENNRAGAVVIDMDTYGGRLDAAEKITNALSTTTLPTYTFIDSNAGSAGALIAFATKHIFMAPVSAIGAAAPILSSGQDLPETARDKTISYWSALVRGMANRTGRNPDLGEAFLNKEKEVKIGERIVHPRGSLLSLNAQEATEAINGKPLLADGVVSSIDELVGKAKLGGRVVTLRPSGFEQLAFWVTALAPILLLVGIVCAYIEFKIPGATLPGAISAVCFVLFFLGHYLAGLAGWEAAALFVLGVAFILIEVFFFAHSTIVFGVVGVFLVVASLVWAMIDKYPDQPLVPSTQALAMPLLNLMIALVASTIAIMILARYLPRTNLYRRFALLTSNPTGPSFNGNREFSSTSAIAPGATGAAVTTLRPSGKARIGDQVIDVVTAGEFIVAETPIVIRQVDGMRVLVGRA